VITLPVPFPEMPVYNSSNVLYIKMLKHALNFLFRQNISVPEDPFTTLFLLQIFGVSMALGYFRTSYITAKWNHKV